MIEKKDIYLYLMDQSGTKTIGKEQQPTVRRIAAQSATYLRVLDFTDVEHSMRVNPIQHRYIPSMQHALAVAENLIASAEDYREIMPNSGSDNPVRQYAVNFLAACIFFFVNYKRMPYDYETKEELMPGYCVDKETGHKRLTGEVFDENGRKLNAYEYYWLGKYSDMPHILAFLQQDYCTMFEILETDSEVFPLIAPLYTQYRNKEFYYLEQVLGTLRCILSMMCTKEIFWILHKSGDDILMDRYTHNYIAICQSQESYRLSQQLCAALVLRKIPRHSEPMDYCNLRWQIDCFRGYNFKDNPSSANRCDEAVKEQILYDNYYSVMEDIHDRLKEEIFYQIKKN